VDSNPPTLSTVAVRAVPIRARRERRRQQWLAVGPVVLGVAGVLGAITLWQLFSTYGPVDQHHLPPPTTVFPVFFANFGFADFWIVIGQTM
jgi:ABC-type nitrate/sulfonate/bicarbonate transport system permease component